MKVQISALAAASLLALANPAGASSGHVGLFDFGDLAHGSGWTLTNETGLVEIYTPGGAVYGLASGSGPAFNVTAGPVHGASANVDAADVFGPDRFMLVDDEPAGLAPGTQLVTFASYVATMTIAPGGSFQGSPLVGLGFTDTNKHDNIATNFARATASISVDTGTTIISNSQSLYQDASSPFPYLMIQPIVAGLTNTSSDPWVATFTMSAEIWAHEPIPEPTNLASMAAGLGLLGVMAKRRRRLQPGASTQAS
jgi:hypothetical protein